MIYKVLSAELKTTSTGKSMKALSVESENGVQQVNIFADFPHYADINAGSSIDGEIRKNDKGYNNLYSNEIKPRGGAPSAFKQQVIEKAVERKESFIEKSQDNKEWGMKVSATWRDAVILATTEFKDKTVLDGLDDAVLRWRRFCWDNFDVNIKDTDALTGKLNK